MTKMTRAKKVKQGVQSPPQLDLADLESVDIDTLTEKWSECRLVDGTVMRIKPVIVEIRKAKEFAPNGDPIYVIKSAVITDIQINPSLRKTR